jgi:hypothetical protein
MDAYNKELPGLLLELLHGCGLEIFVEPEFSDH